MTTTATGTRDPEQVYGEPRQIVESPDLSPRDKLALLESWRADLIELQKATEENMDSANVEAGTNAVKLAKVTEAIAQIHESMQPEE